MFYARVTTTPLFTPRWELNPLFNDTFARAQLAQNELAQTPIAQSEFTPAVNIRENETGLTFAVELPGVKLENVQVTADDGILTIHGHKIEDRKEGEEGRYHLVERSYGSFTRRFQLPVGVDGDKIEADVADGMLEVRIPKAAMPKPKNIRVQAAVGVRGLAAQPLNGDRKASPKKLGGAKQLATAGV